MIQFFQTSPPYPVVCPGDRLVFICTISNGNNVTYWLENNGIQETLRPNDKKFNDSFGSFFANIDEINSTTIISSATNNSAPVELDGTNISCSTDGQEFIKITIDVAGKLPKWIIQFRLIYFRSTSSSS